MQGLPRHTSGHKSGLPHKVARPPGPGLHLSSIYVDLAQSLLRPIVAGMQRQPSVHIPVLQACHSTDFCSAVFFHCMGMMRELHLRRTLLSLLPFELLPCTLYHCVHTQHELEWAPYMQSG